MNTTSRLIVIFFAAWLALEPQLLTSQSTDPARLKKGTRLMLDLDTPLNSTMTREGDTVLLRIRNDIKVRDRIAIPRGVVVKAKAIRVKPAFVNGKSKHAELHLEVDELVFSNGTSVRLHTEALKLESEEIGQSTVSATQSVVRQSLPNAAVGGLIAGRTGAIAGVLAGVGLGAISAISRPKAKGADVDIPQGSIIQTSLKNAVEIPAGAFLPIPVTVAATLSNASAPPIEQANSGASIAPTAAPEALGVPSFEADALPQPLASPNTSVSRTPGVFSLTVDVKLVQVDAVVHDGAGKPMTALQRENFRLFEDGVEQTIQHFSRDELPLAVALVIDRSGSVAPIMDRIQGAAFKALQHLKRGDQVALFAFAGNVELLEGLTADRQRVANRIGTIEPGGGTRIMDAVDEALNYLRVNAHDRRRAVILISDNFEMDSRVTHTSVVESALKTESVIYSVRIRESSPSPLLPGPATFPANGSRAAGLDRVVLLANETGGEVFDAKTSALDAALAAAFTRLKLRYTLGYAPANRSHPGRYHAIEVRLTDSFGRAGSNYDVFARRGYYE